MKKKIISIILTVTLVVSMMTVAMVSASARIDINGRYVPSASDTYRYYFYMPADWENSFTQSTIAGVFWYGGSDACSAIDDSNPETPAWPGYIPQYEGTYNEGSVYYVDCPDDVPAIIWSNYVNGGTYENGIYQYSKEQFEAAKQTIDIIGLDDAETYCNYDLYPEGLEDFDNMIYIIDGRPEKVTVNELSGKETYGGDWYYYYGDGKYGVQPTLEEAEVAGAVLNTSYQPPKSDSSPQQPGNNPGNNYDKSIKFDVQTANWGPGVKSVYCHIYNYFGDDGKTYTDWMTKAEKCDYDPSTGIATYYLKTGIDRGADGLETIDNTNKWVIMFSCNTGAQTYPLVFNSDCFGDTVIADPNTKFENPIDSEKTSIKTFYKNNTNLTAAKCITSTGKVQGETFADGCTNETLLGDYLATYALDDTKVNKEIVSRLADELGIKASDALSYATYKINTEDYYYTSSEKINAINAVKKVIDEIEGSSSGTYFGIYAGVLDEAYEDSGLFVEFYDDDYKLIGSSEIKRYRNSDNTGWYYQGYCANVNITNGYEQVIKDGNGNELHYNNSGSSNSSGSNSTDSATLKIKVSPATSNITFTMRLSEEYTDCYCKELTHDVVKYNLSDYYEYSSLHGYTYDGTPKIPEIEFEGYDLTLGKTKYYNLENGKDYTVTYTNNINAGTATVTVAGIGNYVGTVTKELIINKANQELIANIANTTLDCGSKSQIVAIGEGEITYSSSNESVATVSNKGIVTAVGEGYTIITVNASGNNNYNPDSTRIIVFVNAPGENIILGDVDGDGKIGIDDATNIQKYMAEMLDFTDKQKELADVSKDGKVGVDDVTLIQKHMAGLAVIE